jgi:hypothetical protein
VDLKKFLSNGERILSLYEKEVFEGAVIVSMFDERLALGSTL